MMAALSPLLPDGNVLGYKYANGQINMMTLKNGTCNGGSGITVDSFKMPDHIPIAIIKRNIPIDDEQITYGYFFVKKD